MSDVSREAERDEQRQMLSLPSDGAAAAQWCELANYLAEDRDHLLALVEQQEKALRDAREVLHPFREPYERPEIRCARAIGLIDSALSGGPDE